MNEVKEQQRTNASRLSIAGSTFELILPLSSRANLAPEVAAAGVPSQLPTIREFGCDDHKRPSRRRKVIGIDNSPSACSITMVHGELWLGYRFGDQPTRRVVQARKLRLGQKPSVQRYGLPCFLTRKQSQT
jgi:hypothetical protein